MSTIITKNITIGSRKRNVNVEFYNSAMDVYEDCKKRTITDSSFDDKSKASFGRWEGVETYDEALKYLRNGYQPTVNKLKEKLKVQDPGQKRISFTNNIVGSAPIVPLALKGVPNCMIDTRMKQIKCKVIDVYYDMTCSCGTDSDDIIANGQKMLGAILDLEHQGYRINLYAVQSYNDSSSSDILAVKIKSSNQPLDLKRMSFPLTHTAFFRVIGFDWYSRFPKGKYRSGYGHALGYELNDREMKEFATKMFGDNAIYIAGSKILSRDEEYIKEVLKNAGQKNR
jgi:hypothetical protein